MNPFAAFFAMLRRLTSVGNAFADRAEGVVADLDNRVIPAEAPRLTSAAVDPSPTEDTVSLPAARRNGRATVATKTK